MLRTHCQTSGVSLTEQDPYNTLSAQRSRQWRQHLGGRSLSTPIPLTRLSLCRRRSRPGFARNTQLILQHETGITNVVDPMAGSYYLESLTHSLVVEARKLIAEVEELGGMTKAVESGMPKMRIEEAAARRQCGWTVVRTLLSGSIGSCPTRSMKLTSLDIDNTKVRESQLVRLAEIRASRDEAVCSAALENLAKVAETGEGNLLAACVDAARVRATVGEMSDAMEKVFGRHKATVRLYPGFMPQPMRGMRCSRRRSRILPHSPKKKGRRPRMLVVKLGQDGHDRGAQGLSRRPLLILVLMSISVLCLPRRKRLRDRLSKMTCMSSASRPRLRVTRPSCPSLSLR